MCHLIKSAVLGEVISDTLLSFLLDLVVILLFSGDNLKIPNGS